MKNEIQIGLTGVKNTQERRHGYVPKNSTKLPELTQDNKDTFFKPKFGSEATSRSGIDAEERGYCGFGRLFAHDKVDLTPEERATITVSNKPTSIVTADSTIRTTEQATVNVKDLDMFVTVQLLKDSPALLSLGKLCEQHGYSYEWNEDQSPNIFNNCANFVCVVTRSTTAEFQHNDMMMRANVQNDLGLEMALESMWICLCS